MPASCTSIILPAMLAILAGSSPSPVPSLEERHPRGAHTDCLADGHHHCQVLVPEEARNPGFTGSDCADRAVIDLLWVYTPAAFKIASARKRSRKRAWTCRRRRCHAAVAPNGCS